MRDVIHSRIFVISLAAEAGNVHVIALAYITQTLLASSGGEHHCTAS